MKNEIEKKTKVVEENLKRIRVKANKQAIIHLLIFLICTIFFMMLILDSFGQRPLHSAKILPFIEYLEKKSDRTSFEIGKHLKLYNLDNETNILLNWKNKHEVKTRVITIKKGGPSKEPPSRCNMNR